MTASGRIIEILQVTDEFTRESLSDLVAASIDADATVGELSIASWRAAASSRVRENGQWPGADGQRASGLVPVQRGYQLHGSGKSWLNPWVESYESRTGDELLSMEQFDTLLEAQVLVRDWREEYNDDRPHSALGMLTPTEFAE